ncbi:hypothetical protein GIB67_032128, partial [Kingdonia uniflora]
YITKQGDVIQYYHKSFIWADIKFFYSTVLNDLTWIIGTGSAIDAWRVNWTGMGIIRNISTLLHLSWKSCKPQVSDILINGVWNPNRETLSILNLAGINLNSIFLKNTRVDNCIYKLNIHGVFSMKIRHKSLGNKFPSCWWKKYIWRNSYYPGYSNLTL